MADAGVSVVSLSLDSPTHVSFSPSGHTLVAYFPPRIAPSDPGALRDISAASAPTLEQLANGPGPSQLPMMATFGRLCIWCRGPSGAVNDWDLRQALIVAPRLASDPTAGTDPSQGTHDVGQMLEGGVKEIVWLNAPRKVSARHL